MWPMDRKQTISSLHGLKHLQVGNNLEGFRGIELALDSSHVIILIL